MSEAGMAVGKIRQLLCQKDTPELRSQVLGHLNSLEKDKDYGLWLGMVKNIWPDFMDWKQRQTDAELWRRAFRHPYTEQEVQRFNVRELTRPFRLDLGGLKGLYLPKLSLSGYLLTLTEAPGAWMSRSDFSGSNIGFSKFDFADLSCSRFYATFARNVFFFGANLVSIQCDLVDFSDSSFRGCNLANARLHHCTLDGVDFRGADLTGVDWAGSSGDVYTKWPEGFEPEFYGILIRGRNNGRAVYPSRRDRHQ